MTASTDLVLYSRPDCHLCEQAAQALEALGVPWCEVNVDDDPELERQYGLLIPVVYSRALKKKLLYPFGVEQLSRFLEEIGQ